MNKQYRLSWEMVGIQHLYKYYNADPRYYKNTTKVVANSEIPDEDWHTVSKIVNSLKEIESQYKTLKAWAENDEEPIRNVKLEVTEDVPTWKEV